MAETQLDLKKFPEIWFRTFLGWIQFSAERCWGIVPHSARARFYRSRPAMFWTNLRITFSMPLFLSARDIRRATNKRHTAIYIYMYRSFWKVDLVWIGSGILRNMFKSYVCLLAHTAFFLRKFAFAEIWTW